MPQHTRARACRRCEEIAPIKHSLHSSKEAMDICMSWKADELWSDDWTGTRN